MLKGSRHTDETRAKMRGPRVERRLCIEAGCQKSVLAKGWCPKHYSRMHRRGTMTVSPQRAWNKGLHIGLAPWRGKTRGPYPPEWRAKIAASNRKPKSAEHVARILGRMWHGPKPVYQGIRMRSSYELAFAQACDAAGILWQYEPKRFDLGRWSYTPDFYLPTLGIFVEIKGYFSEESQEKIKLFRERHPEFPLVVVLKQTLRQFAIGMKSPMSLGTGGYASGSSGLEDQLNGLVAQQCANDNGVNCGNPTADTPGESAAEPRRNARKVQRLEAVAQAGRPLHERAATPGEGPKR
jgi:hypothetical protein